MGILGKTIVIGAEGFLGKGFLKAYREYYPDTLGTDYKANCPSKRLDLCHPNLENLSLNKGEYSYALIVAANTNLALCEKEKNKEYRLNVEGTLDLVKKLIKYDIQPILFSTAYVFDGERGGYDELSATHPINEYGRQKEYLEKTIRDICGNHYLMIRCSKVFDVCKGSGTLLDQISDDLVNKRLIRAAHDQVFNPILLEDLVQAVIALQKKEARGLYNVCAEEVWTRLDLVREMAKTMSMDFNTIQPISLDDVACSFRLPKRTNMSCAKLQDFINFRMTPISVCINSLYTLYLNEMNNERSGEFREALVE